MRNFFASYASLLSRTLLLVGNHGCRVPIYNKVVGLAMVDLVKDLDFFVSTGYFGSDERDIRCLFRSYIRL